MFQSQIQRTKLFYEKNARFVPIVGFVLGFIFDMCLLHRIDEPKVIIQQAIYILIAGAFITADLLKNVGEVHPPFLLRKLWPYREFLLHFVLGTLLNSYTIFYFKSASGLTSFIFIFVLIASLTLSEFKSFGKSQQKVHMALLSLCLISYFQSLLPILFGVMGWAPFLASGFASILVFSLYYKYLRPRLALNPSLLKTHVLYPYLAIQGIFTGLYFAHAIPPVPLSVSYMGAYHQVEKRDGQYLLGYTRSWTNFWQHGDETFLARPGDTVIIFIQVFSPTGFKDSLQVRWSLYDQKRGWQSQDVIPLAVTGGRDEGFRAIRPASGECRLKPWVNTKSAVLPSISLQTRAQMSARFMLMYGRASVQSTFWRSMQAFSAQTSLLCPRYSDNIYG
jgi:hypothetical protein